MSAEHLFLDESKSHGYVTVASAVAPAELAKARRDLRGLVLRGQSRLHFYKESPARRRLILAAIAVTGARSTVYSAAGYRRDSDARATCLAGVVTDAAAAGARLLVLEQDDSILHWDRKQLFELTRRPEQPCAMNINVAAANRCYGCPTRSPGAGPEEASGVNSRHHSSTTSATSEQREARLTNRPEDCRAHFHAATAMGIAECIGEPASPLPARRATTTSHRRPWLSGT